MEVLLHCSGGGLSIDELATGFDKYVNLNAGDLKDENQELQSYMPEQIRSFLEKSATSLFPATLIDNNAEETALESPSCGKPIQHAMPVPRLVSAMKGSREKQGLEPRKLNVTWAPDVYDPIPNSLCLTVKGKPRKSRNDKYKNHHHKKSGKKEDKRHSSHMVGGHSKRRSHKLVAGSNRYYRPMDGHELRDAYDDFEVDSQDYCVSSFLKASVIKVHYSVAEAL